MKDQDGNMTQGEQQNPNTSTMNCIEGIGNPPEQLHSITWEKIEKNIPRIIATYTKQRYDREEYNNRFTISQESPYILEIKNSSTFDEGLYACTIKYNLSTGGIGTFRNFKKLEVPSIPNGVIITINNEPLQGEIVYIQGGQTIAPTCTAIGGNPVPKIEWYVEEKQTGTVNNPKPTRKRMRGTISYNSYNLTRKDKDAQNEKQVTNIMNRIRVTREWEDFKIVCMVTQNQSVTHILEPLITERGFKIMLPSKNIKGNGFEKSFDNGEQRTQINNKEDNGGEEYQQNRCKRIQTSNEEPKRTNTTIIIKTTNTKGGKQEEKLIDRKYKKKREGREINTVNQTDVREEHVRKKDIDVKENLYVPTIKQKTSEQTKEDSNELKKDEQSIIHRIIENKNLTSIDDREKFQRGQELTIIKWIIVGTAIATTILIGLIVYVMKRAESKDECTKRKANIDTSSRRFYQVNIEEVNPMLRSKYMCRPLENMNGKYESREYKSRDGGQIHHIYQIKRNKEESQGDRKETHNQDNTDHIYESMQHIYPAYNTLGFRNSTSEKLNEK